MVGGRIHLMCLAAGCKAGSEARDVFNRNFGRLSELIFGEAELASLVEAVFAGEIFGVTGVGVPQLETGREFVPVENGDSTSMSLVANSSSPSCDCEIRPLLL